MSYIEPTGTGRHESSETDVSLALRGALPLLWIRFPTLFYKPSRSLIGPGAPILIPKAAQPVEEHIPDYEVELTLVLGKDAKNVSEEESLDFVLGYVVGNDVRPYSDSS